MPASAIVDIRNTYGALLIGLIVSTILYGVTIAQTWNYYRYYRNRDRKVLQGFVTVLFSLDTLHTILCAYSVYWYLVLNFGNVENLYMDVWAMASQTEINNLVGLLVQLYYARQLYLMSNSIVFPAIIAALGSVTFSLGCYFALKALELKHYTRFGSLTWVTCVGMGSASLADIIIALSMCWCLWHKRTGFARTDSIIMTLMSYSINSGLLTSALATSMLISFVVRPTSLIFTTLFWMMGKCYVNSFLAMLNNRKSLRERSNDDHTADSLSMPSIRQSGRPYKSRSVPTAVAVAVHRTATTDFGFANDDYDQEANAREFEKLEEGIATSSAHEAESIV